MDADVLVDDELQTGQADAVVGNGGDVECVFRVAHVHHDLRARPLQVLEVHALHVVLEDAVVDIADLPLGAGDGRLFRLPQGLGALPGPDDAGHAELAAHDGRMAGPAALVRDDGGGDLHDGLPVGVRHVRHEHLALLEVLDVGDALDDVDGARADLGPDGRPGHQRFLVLPQDVALQDVGVLLGLHRLGPGLEDEELAGHAVLAPLDVHGLEVARLGGVVVLDDAGPPGQGDDLVVADAEDVALRPGDGLEFRRLEALLPGIDHLDLLRPELLLDDGPESALQRRLEDVELVGVHRPLDDGLAEAVGRRDQHGVLEAALGVDREDDPRGPDVGTDHFLHADGQEDGFMIESLVHPVGDRAVREEGGKAVLAGIQEGLLAPDVEIGLLLAREARVRKVLGRGGAADGHVGVLAVFRAELAVGLEDRLLQVPGQFRTVDQVADLAAPRAQVSDVVRVQILQKLLDVAPDSRRIDEVTVGTGRDGIPVGDVDPLFLQVAPHLAQRGVLAPHLGYVLQLQFVKPDDESFLIHFHPPRRC